MLSIDPFVPSEVCLACDVCCRFDARDSVWSPLFLFKEILFLNEKNLVPSCLFSHAHQKAGRGARIQLVKHKEGWACPCFSSPDQKCRIYSARPLDCRLYPFLLLREGEKVFLAIDEKCPYARKHKDAPATRRATAALAAQCKSHEFIRMLKENPEIIQAYPGDYQILEPLPF
jgi:uncharacterized protein